MNETNDTTNLSKVESSLLFDDNVNTKSILTK